MSDPTNELREALNEADRLLCIAGGLGLEHPINADWRGRFSVWKDRTRAALSRLSAQAEPAERHGIRFIDATPDSGYIQRILSAYIDESYFSDNTLGLPPENELCKKMNEWREQRNVLLREALARLSAQDEPAGGARGLRDCFNCGHYTERVSGCDPVMPKCERHRYWISRSSMATLRQVHAYIEGCPRKSITDKQARQDALDILSRFPAAPAPEKGEAKHNAGPCDASPFSSDGNQAPAQPAPSEEEPGLDEHEAALALTYKIETLINETMACGGGISDSEWRAIVYEELHQFIAGNRSALRSRLSEAPLPLLCDVEEALVDLGACDNPYCTDCPRVLPRVREAIREHAAGTEPAGRIR